MAEAKRLFNCKTLDKLEGSIANVLKDSKSLADASDWYYAYVINRDATKYGVKSSTDFVKALKDKGVTTILDKFKADDWTYDGKSFSIESLRVVDLLSA